VKVKRNPLFPKVFRGYSRDIPVFQGYMRDGDTGYCVYGSYWD